MSTEPEKKKGMDSTFLYMLMLICGLLMAVLPFAVFMGFGNIVGLFSSDWRLLIAYLGISLIAGYGISFGAFSLMQRTSCGKVQNYGQIATNAGISLAFVASFIGLAIIPGVRNLVMNLTPPDIDVSIRDSVGYGYYAFWGTLFGIAVGGNLSSICQTKS